MQMCLFMFSMRVEQCVMSAYVAVRVAELVAVCFLYVRNSMCYLCVLQCFVQNVLQCVLQCVLQYADASLRVLYAYITVRVISVRCRVCCSTCCRVCCRVFCLCIRNGACYVVCVAVCAAACVAVRGCLSSCSLCI